MPTPLTITGERTVPGVAAENYWFRRHEAGYAAVPGWVAGRVVPDVVLDAGCGEGYAAGLLADAWPGVRVVGVDYDAVTTAHAARAHGGEQAAYLRGALTALPLDDAAVDVAVSLQVLEHIWTPGDYVRELARVTRPGGVLVVSTPNRLTFSPGLGRRERPAEPLPLPRVRRAGARGRAGPLAARRRRPGRRTATRRAPGCSGRRRTGRSSPPSRTRTRGRGTPGVRAVVESVTAADFVLGDADEASLDLFAVVRLP